MTREVQWPRTNSPRQPTEIASWHESDCSLNYMTAPQDRPEFFTGPALLLIRTEPNPWYILRHHTRRSTGKTVLRRPEKGALAYCEKLETLLGSLLCPPL